MPDLSKWNTNNFLIINTNKINKFLILILLSFIQKNTDNLDSCHKRLRKLFYGYLLKLMNSDISIWNLYNCINIKNVFNENL